MSETVRSPHVLIIGAGLTGLFVAHGLRKAGVEFTIFETEKPNDPRRREWSMGIHWGVPLMESLLPPDLSARVIKEATVDPSLDYITPPTNGARIYDGVTGEVMKELRSDDKLIRASRRKLRKLISEGIDIKYDHRLTNIIYNDDGTVTAHFANQAPHTGTIVLGADSARSVTRELLFAPQDARAQNNAGMVQLSAMFSLGDAERARFVRTAHPVWCMMLHPQLFVYLSVQDAPDPDKPEDWVFYTMICWLGERDEQLDAAQRLAAVRERARRGPEPMMEPFRSLIEWLPATTDLGYVDLSFWVAEPWDTRDGRTTLAGDAAHPMPPYRGQGLNNALQDAAGFVNAMAWIQSSAATPPQQAALIKEYSDEVAARGAEETKLSLKNGYMLVSYHDAKDSPYFRQGLSKGLQTQQQEGSA